MSFIKIENLHWGYSKEAQFIEVLRGVELQADRGEVIALLGQSGAGKSSLLNILGGILAATQGEVKVGDYLLSAMDERQRTQYRRSNIGFVYQFFNLIPTLTVSENLALVLELNGYSHNEVKQQVSELLTALGLEAKADDFPDRLSGGEQQRVAIGRAMIHRPPLVLADEPTGNLDAQSGQQVLELLLEQAKQRNICLIIVTHSKSVAEQADRVLYLAEGRLQTGYGELAW